MWYHVGMSDVTQILDQVRKGDACAAARLLPLVYDELRKLAVAGLARENPNQSLDATALVHEAWLRLAPEKSSPEWENRRHFYGAAAEAMRRILVDHARERNSLKRGGDLRRIQLDQVVLAADETPAEFLALHDPLDKLAAKEPRKAALVKLRLFAGLTN